MAKAKITGRENGPLMIDGIATFIDSEGQEALNSEKLVQLCRCGASGRKPFCDGSHRRIGFESRIIELVIHADI